ncbi:16S rRNA (uracil(1498)-N(3))-methyltransferase [Brevibacterium sp. 5221]|uniref:Ribosomal RNA small subunit methyltransferase E n=1 Tax=Brevibacterium rongguiense TaxID=2695267 RepID=A0A6N9HAH2_9MICO|nr:16S rRNA (uracil(1498)-N(3))-methyltransferase [Brevibacterium rongguiense]MYM20552.1 16S rRNA (uracil(1498)-N(3))-methyltransferase [Brevibacterium rongguiense]
MSLPVFRAAREEIAAARPGGSADFGPEVAGHAVRVRRMRAGERLELVDGVGTRVRGALARAEPEAITVDVEAVEHEPAQEPALVLVQALAKGDRDLAAIEAATEVGIDAVIPWAAQRSIADWPTKKAQRMARQWDNLLTAASLQARRSRFPQLLPLVRGTAAAGAVRPGDRAIVLHEAAVEPFAHALARPVADGDGAAPGAAAASTAHPGRILVFVGPEGGIAEAELAALQAAGARPAVLGPTVLRASTAGPVAAALAQQLLGRWDLGAGPAPAGAR